MNRWSSKVTTRTIPTCPVRVTKCSTPGIDCLSVYTHDPEAAILTRQMNEMGLDVPIVGPTTFSLPTYLSLVTAEETEGFYSGRRLRRR